VRVAVVGVGAIGGYFAAQAALAGCDVVLYARSPFARLVLQSGGHTREIDAPAFTDPAQAEPADWVLLATKAHQTRGAAAWLAATCTERTRGVLVLQNGVEHIERVAPLVGGAPVVPATVLCGAEAVSPGHIVHHGFARLEVPAGPVADELRELFAGTEVEIVAHPDFATAAWRKLLLNVAANPLTALTGKRLRVLARPELRELGLGLIRECVRVAQAEGADLASGEAEGLLDGYARVHPQTGSSMLYDRIAGRPLECDALNGAVVRIGRRHGIPTPFNDLILGLTSVINRPTDDTEPAAD